MSKRHYIIDNGHGGIVNDKYDTATNWKLDDKKTWKKMFVHNGLPIFEGVFNRKLSQALGAMLDAECIDWTMLVPERQDISLPDRAERANKLYDSYKGPKNPYVGISIHSNAAPRHIAGKAKGDEIWTSKGETESDRLVNNFQKGYSFILDTYDRKLRVDYSDGDVDKESNFYILKKTNGPWFLTDNAFFDNPEEAEFMMSDAGIYAFASAHLKGIKEIENYTVGH